MLSLRKSNLLTKEQKKRIDKCSYESIYLLDTEFNDNNFIIKLSGSTLNIYTVILFDNTLICDCMDKFKNTYCKHICFVICFIGQIYTEETFTRKYLNNNEIKSINDRLYNNCDNDPNIIWKYLLDKYNNIKNNKDNKNKFCKENSININTDCSICYNILKEDISKCPKCKNAFHDICIKKWLEISETCALCRDDIWKEFKNNKYLNMNNNKC